MENPTIWKAIAAALAGNDLRYESSEKAGIIVLSVAALLSIIAIVFLAIGSLGFLTRPVTNKTHISEYITCLLVANLVQSIGTAMNLRWVSRNGVAEGAFCSAQGGIKQAGNIGTALWSFMLSIHLFNILFLRSSVTKFGLWCTVVGGWSLVVALVLIGPGVLYKPAKGPYFGISGSWCWITNEYPQAQIFLEYFFEFFSACLSFVLYCVILLRVRGNLVHNMGRWRLKFISKEESWRLGFARDLIDSSMLKLAQRMVWIPVAYTFILLPITVTRLSEFGGHKVPFGATIFGGVVFNLNGFVNVVLILVTRRLFPDMATVPEFNTPRSKLLDVVFGKSGVTPFTLQRSDTADSYQRERQARLEVMRGASPQPLPGSEPTTLQRMSSTGSMMSQVSTTHLISKV